LPQKGTNIWSLKLWVKIHISWWNVNLACIKSLEFLKQKIKVGCIRLQYQWLSCLRFLSHFQSIVRTSSINIWGQVVQVVNQFKKLTRHVEQSIYQQDWVCLFNKNEVKTKIESEQQNCWNKDYFKFNIKRQSKPKQNEENHRLVQWTEVKK